MAGYGWHIVSNLSIALPAAAAFARRRELPAAWYPFLALLWLGFFNEILSLVLVYTIHTNAVNGNIYVLLEYTLLLLQFRCWNHKYTRLCWFAFAAGLAAWVTDNLFLHSPLDNNSYFRIFYSFVIMFFSMDRLNRAAVLERQNLFKNAAFLACTGFLLYYCSKACIEVFNAVPLNLSPLFYMHLWGSLSMINFVSNLIYFTGVLCIPVKQELILPY